MASLVIFIVSFPAFIWVESRVDKPIMPLHLVIHSPRANLIFSNFFAAFLTNAIYFNMWVFLNFSSFLLFSFSPFFERKSIPMTNI